jgi:tetratricopeptide (TPR) repeat protein
MLKISKSLPGPGLGIKERFILYIPKPFAMSHFKTYVLTLALLAGSLSSNACGNEYSRTEPPFYKNKLDLRYLLTRAKGTLPYWYQGKDYAAARRYYALKSQLNTLLGLHSSESTVMTWEQLEQALNKNVDYKLLSDFGWNELKYGKKDLAVKLLEALYLKYPNEYNVVANLGTAYEVTGDNKKALEFLKKAVAINPQSHYGSEWIHINILEQKVLASPDYTKILILGAGNDFSKWLTGQLYKRDITSDSLMVQLAYQLHERISFVAKPDPIVGQLVLDFADLVSIARTPSEANQFYRYALEYNPGLEKPVRQRLGYIRSRPARTSKSNL